MEHITIRNISRGYGQGESAVKALDDVSLDISKGEVCVILGPSGSGKSTLLNMIGGLDRVDSGSITVDGLEITALNKKQLTDYRREKLGMVFQAYNLIPELNVIENVRVVKDIAKEPLDETELLQVLGLEKHMTHFPSELSGGQQQRCSIARALVKNPALLLCDELTGALDSASTRDVLKVLQAIRLFELLISNLKAIQVASSSEAHVGLPSEVPLCLFFPCLL